MQLTPVTSTRIAAIGYDENTFNCYIQFRSRNAQAEGRIYAYANVSPEEFHDFETAPSLGSWFAEHLSHDPEHPYTRLKANAAEQALPKAGVTEAEPQMDGAESFATPENAVETAIALAEQARALEITTPEAYRLAGEELVRIAAERKRRLDFFRPMKEAAFAAHRAICAKENEALAPLALAEQELNRGLVAYRQSEERQRRREQSRLDAEHQRMAEEEAASRAAELQQQYANALDMEGEAELASAARMTPPAIAASFVPPAVVQREVPAVAGLSFSKDWTFTIDNESLVPLSHEWYSLDPKKIRAYVKRMKGHASIPGVRIYPVERSRKRAA